MKDLFKAKPVVILSILSVVLLVLNISSCLSSCNQDSERKKEMARRLDIEEKMTKGNQDKAALLEKLKAKEKELEEEKAGFQAAKKALTQEQLVGQNLKDELQKVTKLKEALEEDLKAALAVNKKAKK